MDDCIDNTMEHSSIRPHQPRTPPPPPPFTLSCLTVLFLASSFLHVFAISDICYSCLPFLSPPRLLGFIHHHPAEACSRRWRCPMKEGPWGSMLCLSVHRMSGKQKDGIFSIMFLVDFTQYNYNCYTILITTVLTTDWSDVTSGL